MARKIVTEDIFKQMKNDYDNGYTIDDIAQKYRFKKNTIQLHFNKHGIYLTNARRFTKTEVDSIVFDYQNGLKPFELANKYHRNSCTIISKLKSIGVYNFSTHRFTKEEIEILKTYYPTGDWSTIFQYMPNVSKQAIYTKMSELGISMTSYFWSVEDENLLIENYDSMYGHVNELCDLFDGRYTYKSIISKANKLGLKTRALWSDDEIEILKSNYAIKTLDELLILLPNRNRNTIIAKAGTLNLVNKVKLDYKFSDEEKSFIVDNYNSMTDKEIAMKLNKKYIAYQLLGISMA